ncbi:hypothetical protein J3P95_16325 [Pseudomonas sp. Z5-35]|uniref:hypothetical protein n=1 Tax=unclassified Pseudomonas TaxID=196821 RepID=UPI003DA8F379
MNSQIFYIPEKEPRLIEGNSFTWDVGAGLVTAEHTKLILHNHPLDRGWTFYGRTGSGSECTHFSFKLFIPYAGDEVLDATYTHEGGLSFSHLYSGTLPDFYRLATTKSAELTIKLDPRRGTATGNFTALIEKEGQEMRPTGAFELIRDQ